MGFPTHIVEVAFTTDPFDTPTWTDISAKVRGFDIRRGRQHELGRIEAGTCTLRLDNRDRRFDPNHAAGPYYPNVVPVRRVRVRATWNAVTYTLFDGFIESWPQKYQGPNEAWVEVEAVDLFKLLALTDLVAYSAEVLDDAPLVYHQFRETSGTTAADASGNGRAGTYVGSPTLGATSPLIGGGDTSVDLDGTDDRVELSTNAALKVTGDFTVEAWVRHEGLPDLFPIEFDAVASAGGVNAAWAISLTALGAVWFSARATTSITVITPSDAVLFDTWTHLVCVRRGENLEVWANGVLIKTKEGSKGAIVYAGDYKPGVGAGWDGSTWGNFLDGKVDEFAFYDKALSPERIAAHYADGAAFDAFSAQLSGAHIGKILDVITPPGGSIGRSLDAGQSTIQAVTPSGDALSWLLKIADSENGLVFITTDGKVGFHERHAVWKAPHDTSQGTFGDAGGELPYRDLEPRDDDSNLWNVVRVAREGGIVQMAIDSAASRRYGRRLLSRDGLLITSDLEAADAANYLLGRYKTPRTRFERLVLDGGRSDDLWPQILGRDIHFDRILVNRRPPGGGSANSLACQIVGVDHDVAPARWSTTWALAPADETGVWILDSATQSVLDTTTRLGY